MFPSASTPRHVQVRYRTSFSICEVAEYSGCISVGRRTVHNFIKAFVRDPYGAWRCVEPATLDLPGGRVQVAPGSVFVRGTSFMNIDLAKLLDEQAEN